MTPHAPQPVIIRSVWRQYFENHDEGLGTTYERFILHRFFTAIRERFTVESVLEAPIFGMTGVSGINSLWWANEGIRVTLVDDHVERLGLIADLWNKVGLDINMVGVSDFRHLPFMDLAFDLSWNFAALWFVPELEAFLAELCRTTRKVILICIPNRHGIGHLVRFGLGDSRATDIHMNHINPETIIDTMEQLGWRTFGSGYFDVPPWPDIAMKKEDLLKRFGFKCSSSMKDLRFGDGICIMDYFNGSKPGMEREVMRYAFLENSPRIIQRFWAHHVYLQFVPSDIATSS